MANTLSAWLHDEHVAEIHDAGTGYCAIRYTDRALALGQSARLSLSLPVRQETYAVAEGATRWLRGLLPEGRALQAAVEQYGVPADDVFGLLSVLGRDVAGAVQIVPEGESRSDYRAEYRPLGDDELAELVSQVHERPLGLDRAAGFAFRPRVYRTSCCCIVRRGQVAIICRFTGSRRR